MAAACVSPQRGRLPRGELRAVATLASFKVPVVDWSLFGGWEGGERLSQCFPVATERLSYLFWMI